MEDQGPRSTLDKNARAQKDWWCGWSGSVLALPVWGPEFKSQSCPQNSQIPVPLPQMPSAPSGYKQGCTDSCPLGLQPPGNLPASTHLQVTLAYLWTGLSDTLLYSWPGTHLFKSSFTVTFECLCTHVCIKNTSRSLDSGKVQALEPKELSHLYPKGHMVHPSLTITWFFF
jgi:hypothetical protein